MIRRDQYLQNFHEIPVPVQERMRSLIRKSTLNILTLVQSFRYNSDELFGKARVQFLYIHHIFRDEEEQLRKLILELSRENTFISYSEGVKRIIEGNIDRPYICLSSDDGLKNNVRAAEIMNEYGISACFFICPSMIGVTDFKCAKKFSNEKLHLPTVEFMDWDDVGKLVRQGHEVGGHTLSHYRISKIPMEQIRVEVEECFTVIKSKIAGDIHFAFPYGRFRDFNNMAKSIVFNTGFKSCASAVRGCHIVKANEKIKSSDLLIRRDHILLDWPISHIKYFMAKNVLNSNYGGNYFPY